MTPCPWPRCCPCIHGKTWGYLNFRSTTKSERNVYDSRYLGPRPPHLHENDGDLSEHTRNDGTERRRGGTFVILIDLCGHARTGPRISPPQRASGPTIWAAISPTNNGKKKKKRNGKDSSYRSSLLFISSSPPLFYIFVVWKELRSFSLFDNRRRHLIVSRRSLLSQLDAARGEDKAWIWCRGSRVGSGRRPLDWDGRTILRLLPLIAMGGCFSVEEPQLPPTKKPGLSLSPLAPPSVPPSPSIF